MIEAFRKEGRVAFIPFIVAGDPDLAATESVIDILVEEGADLLELGVPFSDALADGPVIQAASERASKTMDSMGKVLDFAAKIKTKHPKLPIILFTYFNPILRFGLEAFAAAAQKSGVAAVLVVDLPPEEAGEYRRHLQDRNVKTVFLASPTTDPQRLPLIAEASTGFIYYVSRVGVTGEQKELSRSLATEIQALKKLTDKPIAVGFGISNAEQARNVAKLGDAVVVGSAFVRLIAQHPEPKSMEREVRALARELIQAVHGPKSK